MTDINGNMILLIIALATVLGSFIIMAVKEYIKCDKWDCGIKGLQSRLQIAMPFDPNKDILYVSRRMVGVWESSSEIHITTDYKDNLSILDILSKYYNLVLYIPIRDRNGIEVINLDPSIDFIINYEFPITYITNTLPNRSKTKIMPVTNGERELYFIRYMMKEESDTNIWEDYT